MADDEFTPNSDESEWWHEETFFYVPDSFIEDECQRLRALNLTTDELIKMLAERTYENLKSFARLEKFTYDFGQIKQVLDYTKDAVDELKSRVQKHKEISELNDIIHDALVDLQGRLSAHTAVKTYKSERSKNMLDSQHEHSRKLKAEAIDYYRQHPELTQAKCIDYLREYFPNGQKRPELLTHSKVKSWLNGSRKKKLGC